MTGPTTEGWTPAERAAFEARRRSRSTAIGIVLAALVVLFFGITVVRMAPGFAGPKPSQTAATATTAAPTGAPRPTPRPTPRP